MPTTIHITNKDDQIISGVKTFEDDLSIKNNAFFISQPSGFLSGSNYYGNYNGGVFAGGIRLSQSSLALVENSFSTKWNPSEGSAGSTSRNWKRIVVNGLGKYQIGIVYGGTVYVSDNYGENFSSKTSIVGASNNWSDVAISTDGKYSIASVDQGYVWLSDNYGTNWTQSNILGIRNWKCVALSSTAQYQIAISQDSETIASLWISKNYGKNWTSSAITAKNASSVTISSDGKYQRIALYSNQNSLYSNNYGDTWTSTTQQTTGCLHTRISSDGAYQLLSTDEYVKISKDYGITWVDEFRTPNNKIKDLTISANAHFQAIAVENNYIYASYNYGKSGTWERVGLSGNWSTIDINSNGKNLTAAMSGATSGFVFVSNTDEKVRGDLYVDHMEALNLVYNTGDQIISGAKTFAKGTSLSSGSLSISGDSIENYNLIFSKSSRETATFSIIGFQKSLGSINPANVITSQPHNFRAGDSVVISDIRTISCGSSLLNGTYTISNITSPTTFQYLVPGNESSALSSPTFLSLLTTCSNAPTATALSYFSKSSSLGSDISLNSNNIISNSPFIAPNLVYNTGNQTISGAKTFFNSGVFSLSGASTISLQNNPLSIVGSGNTYIQLNIQNRATGTDASADLVITANNGTDNSNYINLGINNSGYNNAGFTNGTGFDGYLFIDGGDLDIGTRTAGKIIEFHAGGTTQDKTIARINSSGLAIVSGYIFTTVNTAVTAGTNAQGQGPLTSQVNIITTNATSPGAVTLPVAASDFSTRIMIRNTTANGVNVYPSAGARIDGLTLNSPFGTSITQNNNKEFYSVSTGQWYSI